MKVEAAAVDPPGSDLVVPGSKHIINSKICQVDLASFPCCWGEIEEMAL